MRSKDTVVGIEFGSTRIKAVLLDKNHTPLASGAFDWENSLQDGIWTYPYEEVKEGLRKCFSAMKKDYESKTGEKLTTVGAIGVSAMMHGYLAFDEDWNDLVPFRTWRNTMTAEAAEKLTELFQANIPQRWSIAHLYQAILKDEEHLPRLRHITTLAGYVHHLLTGKNVVGIGEASGIMPVDRETSYYSEKAIADFDSLIPSKFSWKLKDLLPEVLVAGQEAGTLTEEGAKLLDESGELEAGIPFVPAEGDAQTGMVATNSVAPRTGNVSAGTSVFIMVVTEQKLGVHKEIGMVTTPTGIPVAMVHCSNCTSDINAWVKILAEAMENMGFAVDKNKLYTMLFQKALEAKGDCDGLLSFNYYSGEAILDLPEGRLGFLRKADADFNLASFMRTNLNSSLVTLKLGLDIMLKEGVQIDKLYGHGGFFKTEGVGQRILSAAAGAPISVMATAGEGGPYGMALLAAYMVWKEEGESLEDYLEKKVFASAPTTTLMASRNEVEDFNKYAETYRKALAIERTAIEAF